MSKPKIIVLDDDPTGSQTVHSCLLLTQWDVDTLRLGLRDSAPLFFILTNTRALPPVEAAQITAEVCDRLKIALAAEGIQDFLIVSRSDSTLRGHYPIETDVIAEKLGDFDAHFLIPAFFEGGRVTRDSIHYLLVDGVETPVHQTEFAQDSVFAYSHSYLPDYVAEKTKGRIPASLVVRFLTADIRQGSLERLLELHNNTCVVVDAENQADLNQFAQDILSAVALGKRFLFRSAASLLTSLAQLEPQPIPPEGMGKYKPTAESGVILVGSHVSKTTQQLERLLQEPDIVPILVDVVKLQQNPESRNDLYTETITKVTEVHQSGKTPVIYTSREEITFTSVTERLAFGVTVSSLLMEIVQTLPTTISFLISKGGITSNDVLSKGLNLKSARLLGQIIPGCSLVRTSSEHPRYRDLPVVLFPGNVGGEEALVTVYHRLKQR
ncbi:MAG: four-carbon acid sugar kinase family protein [Gloeocapsa sp. DLM2.Bin57]|nr:MAG: four-carbon acid sugar kinase family protein [Gloeocapsa sp. DLM2.Bin57]